VKNGFVYFLQQDVTNAVKIGYTATVRGVQQRLNDLQVGSPYKVRALCHTPGDRLVERELHEYFKSHRLAGEWFSPCDELMTFIAKLVEQRGADPLLIVLAGHLRRRRPRGVIERKGRWYYRPTKQLQRARRAAQGLPETIPLGPADSAEACRMWIAVRTGRGAQAAAGKQCYPVSRTEENTVATSKT